MVLSQSTGWISSLTFQMCSLSSLFLLCACRTLSCMDSLHWLPYPLALGWVQSVRTLDGVLQEAGQCGEDVIPCLPCRGILGYLGRKVTAPVWQFCPHNLSFSWLQDLFPSLAASVTGVGRLILVSLSLLHHPECFTYTLPALLWMVPLLTSLVNLSVIYCWVRPQLIHNPTSFHHYQGKTGKPAPLAQPLLFLAILHWPLLYFSTALPWNYLMGQVCLLNMLPTLLFSIESSVRKKIQVLARIIKLFAGPLEIPRPGRPEL